MLTQGEGFWKFNSSLTSNADYVEKIENQIFRTLCLTKTKQLISILGASI